VSEQRTFTIRSVTTEVRLTSRPAGAELAYDGARCARAAERVAAVGFRTSISAADALVVDGAVLRVAGWEDGGGRLRGIAIPDGR
jgi:hypothetical protein